MILVVAAAGRCGFSAPEQPSLVEGYVARTARKLALLLPSLSQEAIKVAQVRMPLALTEIARETERSQTFQSRQHAAMPLAMEPRMVLTLKRVVNRVAATVQHLCVFISLEGLHPRRQGKLLGSLFKRNKRGANIRVLC